MPHLNSSETKFRVSLDLQHLRIPLRTFLSYNPQIERLAVGGLIFHHGLAARNSSHLLLLQRVNFGCAFPSVWEIPGGTCKSSDETILDSLVREVSEETSMQVTQITAQVGDMEYATVKGTRWGKMCFMVKVKEVTEREKKEDIVVDIEATEHCAFQWARVNDVQDIAVMTEGQREVMRTGFNYALHML